MAYPMTQLGGHAFNHGPSADVEQEYDRLRALARQEHDQRSACLDKAHSAYGSGDGSSAHQFSEQGKRHGAAADAYNRQASAYIFRENNAPGRVDADTIDLHGQYVEEAEEILEQRIATAKAEGQRHLQVYVFPRVLSFLSVSGAGRGEEERRGQEGIKGDGLIRGGGANRIVGKGNHSAGHVQKLKPAVERICREQGLQCVTEENAGRIDVDLTGGMPAFSPQGQGHYPDAGYPQQQQHQQGQGYGQGQYYPPAANGAGYPGQAQGAYGGAGQHGQNQGQANDQNAEIEAAVAKYLPRILRKLEGCCVVM